MNNSHCESLIHRGEAIRSFCCFKIASLEKNPEEQRAMTISLKMASLGKILSLSLFKVEVFFVNANERRPRMT